MGIIKNLHAKYEDYIQDHPILKFVLNYIYIIGGATIAAMLLAFSYRAFVPVKTDQGYNLIGGGVAGFGQVIILLLEKIGVSLTKTQENNIASIVYFVVNIPLFFLAFFGIGKRFAIISLYNVFMTSIFISILPDDFVNMFNIQNDLITRAIIAGFIHGLGIAIAVELNTSTGGTDIISMYFALKKGISVGSYILIINAVIVVTYTILASISTASSPSISGAATMALYTLIYFFVSSLVIDKISSRNKKVQLVIVTQEPKLAKVFIQHFPHGCTVIDARGAYQDKEKKVIHTVISSFELKTATKIIYKVDPHAFITVNQTYKVFGKFFIKPIK